MRYPYSCTRAAVECGMVYLVVFSYELGMVGRSVFNSDRG